MLTEVRLQFPSDTIETDVQILDVVEVDVEAPKYAPNNALVSKMNPEFLDCYQFQTS
jgi:hypothetical protein